ncbi:hypothetical protein HGO23_06035 [Xenorhabdus budapestensis]|uniref:Uncharacterized protein n=1 Tax=Xenorhabdus budapestensis TaxID=290110 RepID=A0ABX7VJE8_XENBU|nr:hypothetical protein [Xenorhabdus budapestensis]QTL40901.1 hypothetical protein HGO23_06035 [Xenorhabdus budapestensis]
MKKLITLLLIPFVSVAIPEFSGVYRDDNFNILAYDGSYLCKIRPAPKKLTGWNPDIFSPIGEARLVTETNGDTKFLYINLGNGKEISRVETYAFEKGSASTMYLGMSKNSIYTYFIVSDYGTITHIEEQDVTEGALALTDCTLVRKY